MTPVDLAEGPPKITEPPKAPAEVPATKGTGWLDRLNVLKLIRRGQSERPTDTELAEAPSNDDAITKIRKEISVLQQSRPGIGVGTAPFNESRQVQLNLLNRIEGLGGKLTDDEIGNMAELIAIQEGRNLHVNDPYVATVKARLLKEREERTSASTVA